MAEALSMHFVTIVDYGMDSSSPLLSSSFANVASYCSRASECIIMAAAGPEPYNA